MNTLRPLPASIINFLPEIATKEKELMIFFIFVLTNTCGGKETSLDVPLVVSVNGCISGERKNGIVQVGLSL